MSSVREQAIVLRKKGYSYSYISTRLGVGKGTLSYWLSTIPYAPNSFTTQKIGNAHAKSGEYKSALKRTMIHTASSAAKQDIGIFTKRDLFILGIGLYIGEGTKTNDQIRVVNADPLVIKAMISWFKKVCGLSTENFYARIHGYPDIDIAQAIAYWSKELQLPKDSFKKTQIDTRLNKTKIRAGKLPFGTLHLTIRSNGNKEFGVFLARKIAAWMSVSLQKAGIV